MTAGPYCKWCGQNVECRRDCPGPPNLIEVEVPVIHRHGRATLWVKVSYASPDTLPPIEGLRVRLSNGVPYYDGR